MCDLIDAATDGDLAKVTELLKNVKDVDYIDECGYTALHCAAENGHLDIVRELIKAGANINKVTFDTEFTALHFAVSKAHYTVASALIEAGADLNLCNQAGCYGTPLHYAISKGGIDMVKTLIKKGAEVNVVSGQGYSPLLLATSLEMEMIVQILLMTGAEANTADFDGKTPLHLAASQGFGKIVKLLADAGADLNAQDGEGLTPEALADKAKENEITAFLKACASGSVPAEAPKGKVKEVREFRTIEPIEGCGEGCAAPM